ncbi:MAG: cytidine deaminase [Ruminococcus sp.]|nr:cytidine deaminase [Ruminococcus sp.]
MNPEMIFNAAYSAATQLIESGAYTTPADTVCSLQTASGRIFTGFSHSNMVPPVHAEVEAIGNMLAAGENAIQGILLISTQGREPLLPCNNCIGYILSLAPENTQCMIAMSDRMIRITEVSMFAAPMGGVPKSAAPDPQVFPMNNAPAAAPVIQAAPAAPLNPLQAAPMEEAISSSANIENAKGDLLKNKVQSIMGVADNDDIDEFLEEISTKKKRFGFFRK